MQTSLHLSSILQKPMVEIRHCQKSTTLESTNLGKGKSIKAISFSGKGWIPCLNYNEDSLRTSEYNLRREQRARSPGLKDFSRAQQKRLDKPEHQRS
ncbi:hypothetical protein AVEN_37955-1 [Araneus ventricosus]|uniref:Uncharacterized protein n=1 Tax=Araneus ventricosus TaxID=182803 RepID=A0A4Y2X653_ARAVE|nr:hypothetical protein AVEN_37955-1 [Araneus ventricosus]